MPMFRARMPTRRGSGWRVILSPEISWWTSTSRSSKRWKSEWLSCSPTIFLNRSSKSAILCDFNSLVPQSGRQWCDMFHAEVDMSKRLMTMSFAQNVGSEEMKSCLEKVRNMLVDIKPGFRLLTDLSSLESMSASCATDLGKMMNLCNGKGVSAALRVVPDPRKDIGFTLMSQFHYGKHVDVTTYETLADAIQNLAA